MITIPTSIPIHIHPLFWVVAGLIGFLNSGFQFGPMIAWVLVIFVSILFHELGHAITARLFGQKARVDLVGFGGLTTHTGKDLSAWKNFLIILNGPLAGFALFLGFFWMNQHLTQTGFFGYSIRVGMVINLLWTALNLLPILPLDGGQMLRVVLERFLGVNGLKITTVIGCICAGTLGLLSLLYSQYILAVLFLFFAVQSFLTTRALQQMKTHDSNPKLVAELRHGQKLMVEGKSEEAIEIFERLREETKEGIIYLQSTQMLAMLIQKKGDLPYAYQLLNEIQKELSLEGKAVLQELAFHEKKYDQALLLGQQCYEKIAAPEIAFKNGCCCARLGKTQEAIGWIQSAVDKGLQDPIEILQREDFDSIRQDSRFVDFVHLLEKNQ